MTPRPPAGSARDAAHPESMSGVFDRLVDLTSRMAEANPEPAVWEQTASERATAASDRSERVRAVIRDYKLESLTIDHRWFHTARVDDVELAVTEAVNAALGVYLEAEFAEAADTHYGIEGVHAGLRQLSEDFSAAFAHRLDEISVRPRRGAPGEPTDE